MSDMAMADLEDHICSYLVRRFVRVESNAELRERLGLPEDVPIGRVHLAMGHLITRGKVRRSPQPMTSLAPSHRLVTYWWAASETPECVKQDRRDAGKPLVLR
jgi:hypothetical protein